MKSEFLYENEDFGFIRAVRIGATILFKAIDVAKALHIKSPYPAIKKHCAYIGKHQFDGELMATNVIDSDGVSELLNAFEFDEKESFAKWLGINYQAPVVETPPYKFFNHDEFGEVRTIDVDGEIWFVASDVARALGYERPKDAIRQHCKKSKELGHLDGAVNRRPSQMTKIINLNDVYRLIFRSDLESAERFRDWLADEVLPSIQKHGVYMTPDKIEEVLFNPDTIIKIAQALKDEQAKTAKLTLEIEEARPKVEFADALKNSEGVISIGVLAKVINQSLGIDIGQNKMFKWLRNNGYLMRTRTDYNLPTQKSINAGLMEIEEYVYETEEGHYVLCRSARVTVEGQKFFIKLFRNKRMK